MSIHSLSNDFIHQQLFQFLDFHDLSILTRGSKTEEICKLARQALKPPADPIESAKWNEKKGRWIQGDPDYCDFINDLIGRVRMNRLPALEETRNLGSIRFEDFPKDPSLAIVKCKKSDGVPFLAFCILTNKSAIDPSWEDYLSIQFIYKAHPTSHLWRADGGSLSELIYHYTETVPNGVQREIFVKNYLPRLVRKEPCGMTITMDGKIIEVEPKRTQGGESVISLLNPWSSIEPDRHI
jgi:hypothetical protein